jgi:DNA-binding response OmpR family regulator
MGKILVVTSNPDLEKGIIEPLQGAGYQVEATSETSVVLGIPLADVQAVLIVTVEASSRTEHVCSTIRLIRPSLPIIVVGPDVAPIKLRLFALGADDYIPRPFDWLELLARIKSLIRKYLLSVT